MVMMVLRGDRNLSAKTIYRLEELEHEAAARKSTAAQFVENYIGDGSVVAQLVRQGHRTGRAVEVAVEYQSATGTRSLPPKVAILLPAEEHCRKLRSFFAETLDTRVIALACLPKPLRNEGFLNTLTAESRTRLTNAALGLVIPDWRTLVASEM
jgi:hypothetical protein